MTIDFPSKSLTLIIFCTFLMCGCQSMHKNMKESFHKKHNCNKEISSQSPSVIVGGNVKNPGLVKIPENGLTLMGALAISGGTSKPLESGIIQVSLPGKTDSNKFVEDNLKTIQNTLDSGKEWRESPADQTKKNKTLSFFTSLRTNIENYFKIPTDSGTTNRSAIKEKLEKATKSQNKAKANPSAENIQIFLNDLNDLKILLNSFSPSNPSQKAIVNTQGALIQNSSKVPQLVALRRGHGLKTSTHYFTYELATSGLVGDINIENGDKILVVPLSETSLGADLSPRTGSQNLLVRGYVVSPGRREIKGVTLGNLFERSNNEDLTKPQVDGSGIVRLSSTIIPEFAAVTLTRTTPSGIGRDIYIFSYRELSKLGISNVQTVGDDLIDVMPMAQVPIVTQSLIDSFQDSNDQFISESIAKTRPSKPRNISSRIGKFNDTYLRPVGRSLTALIP